MSFSPINRKKSENKNASFIYNFYQSIIEAYGKSPLCSAFWFFNGHYVSYVGFLMVIIPTTETEMSQTHYLFIILRWSSPMTMSCVV